MPTYGELLCMLDLKTISMMTIRRWIKILGYRYDENKFSYYTNMHACDNVVEDRYNHYLKEYVTAEQRTYHWIQVIEDTAIKLELSNTIYPKNYNYNYFRGACELPWHKYHVDTHPVLERLIGCNNVKYGGNRSVRIDPNSRSLNNYRTR